MASPTRGTSLLYSHCHSHFTCPQNTSHYTLIPDGPHGKTRANFYAITCRAREDRESRKNGLWSFQGKTNDGVLPVQMRCMDSSTCNVLTCPMFTCSHRVCLSSCWRTWVFDAGIVLKLSVSKFSSFSCLHWDWFAMVPPEYLIIFPHTMLCVSRFPLT